MISSKKIQFVIILILTCILLPVFSGEPNEPAEPNQSKAIVEYDIREVKPPEVEVRRYPPPYGASYLAKVYLKGDWRRYDREEYLDAMLESKAGKEMSPLQRELLSEKYVKHVDYGATIGGYSYFLLYGIDPENTKYVVEAFLASLAKQAQGRIGINEASLEYHKKKLEKAKKELPEKENRLEKLEEKYEQFKAITHHMFSDSDEVFDAVKESLMENDKALDKIKIEISVIREKLGAIEIYKEKVSDEVEEKLDEMQVNLMIELKGLEARRKAVEEIRNYESEFLSSYIKLQELRSEVSSLKSLIIVSEREINSTAKWLDNPTELMQPPHVLQNKVEIFPLD